MIQVVQITHSKENLSWWAWCELTPSDTCGLNWLYVYFIFRLARVKTWGKWSLMKRLKSASRWSMCQTGSLLIWKLGWVTNLVIPEPVICLSSCDLFTLRSPSWAWLVVSQFCVSFSIDAHYYVGWERLLRCLGVCKGRWVFKLWWIRPKV